MHLIVVLGSWRKCSRTSISSSQQFYFDCEFNIEGKSWPWKWSQNIAKKSLFVYFVCPITSNNTRATHKILNVKHKIFIIIVWELKYINYYEYWIFCGICWYMIYVIDFLAWVLTCVFSLFVDINEIVKWMRSVSYKF